MAVKNIVLLSDGTGNAASSFWRTNVWRTFEAIDLSNSRQVALYADGVGTSSFKPLAILGGMFGWGLKRNVIECYKFVCRSYQAGDRIYGFGFSRGAYTIRVAMKLILTQGLVAYENDEAKLQRHALAAYRAFRKENTVSAWYIKLLRLLRDFLFRTRYQEIRSSKDNIPKIRFLGLWDTVAAYGLPVEEMTRFYSRWIFPFEVLVPTLHPNVERACHALSIDDERTTFHPVLWTETKDDTYFEGAPAAFTDQERISQVWFAGVHTNVGGGYPDDSLAHVSLIWMMKEASKCDLRFKKMPEAEPDALRTANSARDKDGRLYDSRKGLASYYRYGPRDLKEICNRVDPDYPENNICIDVPKIHCSVFERIRNGAHPYAPIGLPDRYAVVTEDQRIASGDLAGYETQDQAQRRFQHQNRIWDGVWKRRMSYFGIVIVTALLILYPLFYRVPAFAEYSSRLRPVSDIIRLVGSFIPTDLANFWIDQYARDPSIFLCGASALTLFIFWNARIGRAIADDMRGIWKSSFSSNLKEYRQKTWIHSIRSSPFYTRMRRFFQIRVLPFGSAVVCVYLFVTVLSHLAFNFFDAAGLVCTGASSEGQLRKLAVGEKVELTFNTSSLCQSTNVALERDGRYLIKFDSTITFFDGKIPASKGFTSSDIADWPTRMGMVLATPLRREWFRPWFRVVARLGDSGGEESFLDPDLSDRFWIDEVVRATRDGELFLFVNDAVIGIPGLFDVFYANNKGTAQVTIIRRR